jgi:hypothetical protein
MQEWKIRQEIYHRLTPVFDDDLNTKEVEVSEDIVNNAARYFKERDIGWIYPAKSYMVGICYARWLAREFSGRPLEYLDDSELLYKNDPYFIPYSADPSTYIQILEVVGGWEFNEELGMVPDVYQYFLEEFQIGVM